MTRKTRRKRDLRQRAKDTKKKKISNGSITYGFANKSGPEIEVLSIK